MPERNATERAERAEREGKAGSTQAGEFIREEMHHIREGRHGADSPEQAVAIGLSKARRAGVEVPPPCKGQSSAKTRKRAARDRAVGHGAPRRATPSAKRSRASLRALKRKGRGAASRKALSRQGRKVARRRSASERSASARKAVRTRRRKRQGSRP